MENLGNRSGSIRPSKMGQIVGLVLAVAVFISIFAVPIMWDGMDWFGMPSEYIMMVLSGALIALTVYQLIRGASDKATIELYENGIKAENFTAFYKGLQVVEKSGAVNRKLEFTYNGKMFIYDHPVSVNDLALIRVKIAKASREAKEEENTDIASE